MTVTIYGDRDAVIGHLSESSLKSEKATVIVGQEPDIKKPQPGESAAATAFVP